MQPIDITWGRVFRIYWLFFWRGFVGGVGLGALSGVGIVIFRHFFVSLGHAGVVLATSIGGVIGIVWAVVVIRMALRKRYRGFRLIMIEA
jgi:hypothetical protein